MTRLTDLEQLRIAAEQREWNTLQDTLKRMLALLDPLIALSIAAPRLRAFLPRFEQYYPEARWVRELLLTVITYASAPRDLPLNALNQFPQPGCGNFILAVFDAARTVQPQYHVYERYSHITNAIANAILADLQYTYFKHHPQLYAQLLDPNTDQATRTQIQATFWLDENIAKRDTALWLHVANLTEKALEEKFTP